MRIYLLADAFNTPDRVIVVQLLQFLVVGFDRIVDFPCRFLVFSAILNTFRNMYRCARPHLLQIFHAVSRGVKAHLEGFIILP